VEYEVFNHNINFFHFTHLGWLDMKFNEGKKSVLFTRWIVGNPKHLEVCVI
jgi:hypothetical protein